MDSGQLRCCPAWCGSKQKAASGYHRRPSFGVVMLGTLDRESAHTAKRFNMILVPAELPRRGRGALN